MDFQDYHSPSKSRTPCSDHERDRGIYKQIPSQGRKPRTTPSRTQRSCQLRETQHLSLPQLPRLPRHRRRRYSRRSNLLLRPRLLPRHDGLRLVQACVAANSFLEADNIYPADYCVSDPTGPYSAYIDFAYPFSGVYAMTASGTAYVLTPSQCDPSPNTIWYVIFCK